MRLVRYSLLASALLLATAAHADFGDQVGPDTLLWQEYSNAAAPPVAVAMGREGQSIAVWRHEFFGIPALFSQRFAVDGEPVGEALAFTEFSGMTETFGAVVVAIGQNGVATVAWETSSADDSGDIKSIRIGNDGIPLAPAIVVNATTEGRQSLPSIAADSLDHVLVTWTSPLDASTHGVFGQLFHGGGGFQFGEFRVDESGASAPIRSQAVLGDCCEVVVAWQVETAADSIVYARSFALSANPWTPELAVVTWPLVAGPIKFAADMDFDSNVRIVWLDGQDEVLTIQLDPNLQAMGPWTTLSGAIPPDADSPLWLGLGHDGSGAVAWRQKGDGLTTQNVLVGFDTDNTLTERTVFPFDPPNDPSLQDLAVDADGDLLLAWHRGGPFAPSQELRVGRFAGPANALVLMDTMSLPSSVENGAVVVLDLPIFNANAEQFGMPGIGVATGVVVEIDLDDGLTVENYVVHADWSCEMAATIVCRKALLAAETTEHPIALMVRAPSGSATLTNQFTLNFLETPRMPELGSATHTLVVSDSMPDPFVFVDQTDVALNTLVVSAPIVLGGFDTPVMASVTDGDFSVGAGAFSNEARMVNPGDSIRVRHTSAATYSSNRHTTLTVANVADVFSSTTAALDTTPTAFAFVDRSNLATAIVYESAPITVAGINAPSAISIVGGSYRINGGAYTSAAGNVAAGDQVTLRVTSASTANSAVNATLTIGGVSDTFSATTGSVDTTPNAFAFTDVTGARRNKTVISNSITVSGINAAVSINVFGGSAVRYSKNGGAFTSSAGSVVAGDTIRLQLLASSIANTRIDATATIGGVSDVWSVTTGTR